MFAEATMRAIAAAQATERDLRAARSRTRRHLHEPRPPATSEIRARVGLWKAQVKAACLAGYISKGGDKYLHELLAIPSVARGDYCLYSDAEMGQRLNLRGNRTVRRHRADALKHGLIEVLGRGKDRKPCMVRPVLRDGSPVFLDQKLAGRSDTNGRLTRPVVAADLLFTDTLKTELPPLPPAPDTAKVVEEGGGAFDRVEDEEPAKPVEVASPAGTAQATQQAPAEPPRPEEGPTQHSGTGTTPARPVGASSAPGAKPAELIAPAKPVMSFPEFWLAMGRTGSEGYARARWAKLTASDKAAIRDRLGRPRSWAADMWAGKWLECRVWEEAEAAPAGRPEQVWLHERTAEWRCWQRHLMATTGRGTPVDHRGGWWFPSKLPPLKEGARR
jgi:hypothetical protein